MQTFPPFHVAVTQSDHSIKIYNDSWREIDTLIGHKNLVYCLVSLPDGRLVSGSSDKTIRVWNLETKTCEIICQGSEICTFYTKDDRQTYYKQFKPILLDYLILDLIPIVYNYFL